MKTLPLSIILAFSALQVTAQFPDSFPGNWEGTGTLMGNKAVFSMSWKPVLNGRFIKLSFQNKLDNGSFSMQAVAYYQFGEDSTFKGEWFDSRGISFPVSGTFTATSITSNWGTPETEEGRTEYVFLESGEIKVTDFVLREGKFTQFGEAIYQPKKEK